MTDAHSRFLASAHIAWHALVPDADQRVSFTLAAAPVILAYLTPLIFLAYLARRPNTYVIRLLLLPAVLVCILKATYSYQFDEYHGMHNWLMGYVAISFCSLSV